MAQRERSRLLIGSLGLGLVITGLIVFLGQMYRAIDTGHLESVPVGSLLRDPMFPDLLPASWMRWIQRIPGELKIEGAVTWLLDEVPLAAFLAVVGGLAAWRTLVREQRSTSTQRR